MKKHTTTQQAVEVSKKCGAWRTVLTHYSPRYAKIAEVTQAMLDNKIMIAFDHTRFTFGHLEWAYKLVEIYAQLIQNDPEPDMSAKELKEAVQKPKIDHFKKNKKQKKELS